MDYDLLRLECLKLAASNDHADRAGKSIVELAREFYQFATNQEPILPAKAA